MRISGQGVEKLIQANFVQFWRRTQHSQRNESKIFIYVGFIVVAAIHAGTFTAYADALY
jgi:hypothetical protein